MRRFIVAVATTLALSSSAKAAEPDCAKLSAAVEDSLKSLSVYAVQGNAAAPSGANQLMLISLTFQQMQKFNCPLPTRPLTESRYMKQASKCLIDRLPLPRGQQPASCDQSKWTPEE